MTVALYVTDAAKDVTGLAVRKGGALKTVTDAWVRAGGALKQFYAAMQITLSAYSIIGRGNSATIINVTSAPVTATAVGAIGTVSWAWTRTAPNAQPWTIDSPNAATTTFSTVCDQSDDFAATFIATGTDQAGQVVASAAVAVDCANIYYGGGYDGSAPPGPGRYYP